MNMREKTRTNWHARVELALERIFASLDEPLAWQTLARQLNASPWHFHRRFRRLTGETLEQCLRRLRLEKAAFQVTNSSARITDIALEGGFETLESFLKAFRRAHGISPGAMRRLGCWQGQLTAPSNLHYQPGQVRRNFFIVDTGAHQMNVKITELAPQRLTSLRNIGNYWGLPATWQRLFELLGQQGALLPPRMAMSVFHDHHEGVPEADRRADAGVALAGEFVMKGDLFVQEIPGGLYAIYPHFGSYEEIGPVWERWRTEWLPASGWQLDTTRPSLEWYQNSPDTQPELLMTYLCDPVQPETRRAESPDAPGRAEAGRQ
jgi:AraC family transcriptional regulator